MKTLRTVVHGSVRRGLLPAHMVWPPDVVQAARNWAVGGYEGMDHAGLVDLILFDMTAADLSKEWDAARKDRDIAWREEHPGESAPGPTGKPTKPTSLEALREWFAEDTLGVLDTSDLMERAYYMTMDGRADNSILPEFWRAFVDFALDELQYGPSGPKFSWSALEESIKRSGVMEQCKVLLRHPKLIMGILKSSKNLDEARLHQALLR